MGYVKAIDGLPWILKLIIALPGLDLLYGIYRLVKGVKKNDLVLVIVGIIWIFSGWAILWIIDLITVFLNKKITVFA